MKVKGSRRTGGRCDVCECRMTWGRLDMKGGRTGHVSDFDVGGIETFGDGLLEGGFCYLV